jgi:hypothetical protein
MDLPSMPEHQAVERLLVARTHRIDEPTLDDDIADIGHATRTSPVSEFGLS